MSTVSCMPFSKLYFRKVLNMLDHFGRKITYLRLSVTELCNLRCRYCMPEEGICRKEHSQMMTEEEMVRAVRACVGLGISKIRITGGEPLVKKNILSICRNIHDVPGVKELCVTTNGIMLTELAEPLKQEGVSRLNISLDTLDQEKYRFITRRGTLRDALDGIEAALSAGFEKIKINTVLIGGFNDDEIPQIAQLTRTYPVDVRFIELMPMYDSRDFGPDAHIPGDRVLQMLPELKEYQYEDELPKEGVARLYRLPDSKGCVGLISPLSSHFCGSCNRIRITADGKVKPCLHKKMEYPIKGLTEEEMKKQIEAAILAKPRWHGELSPEHRSEAGRNMNQIGG